jgi:predicted RNA-binding Zn-ribbon protein involved in translation (DUF1610 family)
VWDFKLAYYLIAYYMDDKYLYRRGYFMDKSKWVNWEDAEFLQEVLNRSKSRVDALKNMGYNPKSSSSRKKLNNAIEKFNLDINNFELNEARWEVLPQIINDCFCLADVVRAVGLKDVGGNSATAKAYIKKFNLDTSHFDPYKNSRRQKSLESSQIFKENSTTSRSTLRSRMIKEKVVPYKCGECGIPPEWNGKELVLQVEHINGDNSDNRINNLKFLCPNCHTQTPTWGSKKR